MGNGGWIGRGSGVLALLFINLPEAIFVKKIHGRVVQY